MATTYPVRNAFVLGILAWGILIYSYPAFGGSKLFRVGTNIKDIRMDGHPELDPFKNGIKRVTGKNPWKPEYLREMKAYRILRLAAWTFHVDGRRPKGHRLWSERKLPSDPNQTSTLKVNGNHSIVVNDVAYEWKIDLCNRLKTDYWLCVPYDVDDEFYRELATLIRDSLNPAQTVYLEWSNETWNSIFDVAKYCKEQGAATGMPGQNVNEKGWAYYVHRSAATWKLFEDVFKQVPEGRRPRLVKVLSGQQGNSAVCGSHMVFLADKNVNPVGMQPDVYTVGAYIEQQNPKDGEPADGKSEEVFDILSANTKKLINQLKENRWQLDRRGYQKLPLVFYEGGQHLYGKNVDVANRDPRIYRVYYEWLSELADLFPESFVCHYVHSSIYNFWGAWGAKEAIGQDMKAAHKYRAICDWLNANARKSAPPTTSSGRHRQVSYGSGFSNGKDMWLNYDASVRDNALLLTPASKHKLGTAFFRSKQDITEFNTSFQFQLLNPSENAADGFTFVLQNVGHTARSPVPGGSLGCVDIGKRSLAIRFEFYGSPSTGLIVDGKPLEVVNLPSKLDFDSSDVFQADVDYDGKALHVRMTNTRNKESHSHVYKTDLRKVLQGDRAWVGFTAATGNGFAEQRILSWKFVNE